MKKIELYRFAQDTNVWFFTSSSKPASYDSNTYEPIPIGRSIIEGRGELSKANIEITISILNTVARGWMNRESDAILTVTVYEQSVLGTYVIWKGRLASITPQDADIKFVFESVFTSLRRPGLRARYQRICRHALYFSGCNLDMNDFGVVRSVTVANGAILTIPSASGDPVGDYYTGMLKAPDGTFRFIIAHSGSSITLARQISSLNAAVDIGPTDVTLYPGCDRSRSRCKNRFNNLPNNGSFPYMPPRNPFDGSSII